MNFGTKLIHASGDIDHATGSVSTHISNINISSI